MIIAPLTISVCVVGLAESTLDSKQWSEASEPWLMWRGKRSQSTTWLRRWKRESWIKHLSTRTFSGSLGNDIEDWWISCLADSRANPFPSLEVASPPKTSDTCGRTSATASRLFSPESSSSRTSMGSQQQSHRDMNQFSTMSSATWKKWVSQQRQECSQRRKSGPHIFAEDGSSSVWPTPITTEATNGNQRYSQGGTPLSAAVNWPTATVGDSRNSARHSTKTGVMHEGTSLVDAIRIWPSPSSRDWKDTPGMSVKRSDRTGNPRAKDQLGRAVNQNWPTICAHDHHMGYQDRNSGKKGVQKNLETVVRDGPHDQENSSTDGNPRGLLSPDWVDILMGFPAGWTDSGHLETPASPK